MNEKYIVIFKLKSISINKDNKYDCVLENKNNQELFLIVPEPLFYDKEYKITIEENND